MRLFNLLNNLLATSNEQDDEEYNANELYKEYEEWANNAESIDTSRFNMESTDND